jgi:hypothetical protein
MVEAEALFCALHEVDQVLLEVVQTSHFIDRRYIRGFFLGSDAVSHDGASAIVGSE